MGVEIILDVRRGGLLFVCGDGFGVAYKSWTRSGATCRIGSGRFLVVMVNLVFEGDRALHTEWLVPTFQVVDHFDPPGHGLFASSRVAKRRRL